MYKSYHMIQFKLPKLLIEALILIRYINNLYCFILSHIYIITLMIYKLLFKLYSIHSFC